jgi:hypothetical protein
LQIVAVVVAILVARRGAVGEVRLLIDRAFDAALHRNVEAVEAMAEPGKATPGGEDRQPGKTGLDVRAARIVGTDDKLGFEVDAGVARHVDPAGELAVDRGPVLRRLSGVGVVGAAQVPGEFMARPVRVEFQLRRDRREP